MEIGTDIEEIKRFKLKKSDSFVKNNFTASEIEFAFSKENPESSLAGFFCAKEAVIKTLERQDILLNQLEIQHNSKGKPILRILKAGFSDKFSISIAHCKYYAIAMALNENGN